MEERLDDQHPLERFMGRPSRELRIGEVTGAKVFPQWKHDEVIVFVEYNGYRKAVKFPAAPAPLQETQAMTITIHASGGIKRTKDIPPEKQTELATNIAGLIKAALEANCAMASGTVTIGTRSATFSASSPHSADVA